MDIGSKALARKCRGGDKGAGFFLVSAYKACSVQELVYSGSRAAAVTGTAVGVFMVFCSRKAGGLLPGRIPHTTAL